MAWIKKNLVLVVSGLVALALLGLAGFYLFSRIALDREVTQQVDSASRQLSSLVNRNPHPGTDEVDNISAAEAEVQRLETFAQNLRQLFVPVSYPQNLSSRDLRVLLDNTVDNLQRQARGAGVELPSDYWFSFGSHKQTLNFSAASLEPLASQLAEVNAICRVLFDSRVNQLVRVKRPNAPGETASAFSADYLADAKATTNDWAVATPYEVTFRSFSSELSNILDAFIRSPHCIIVRNLVVDSSERPSALQDGFMDPYGLGFQDPYGRPSPGGAFRGMDPRYGAGPMRGMDPRYGVRPQMPMPIQPRRPGGLTTVVDEKPLTVTLTLDVIRLRPEQPSR
jgi:hypothetical protein